MTELLILNNETWLVCGGRDFADEALFTTAMGDLARHFGAPQRIINGGASGADRMASQWALRLGLNLVEVYADWSAHGRAAGPVRNQQMLDQHKPHRVIAFPGGRGTADMKNRARKAGITLIEIAPQ